VGHRERELLLPKFKLGSLEKPAQIRKTRRREEANVINRDRFQVPKK
jgi:hypothetical protein